MVFLVSAILHEYCVSVPLRIFKAYAFLGMLLQVKLTTINNLHSAKIILLELLMLTYIVKPELLMLTYTVKPELLMLTCTVKPVLMTFSK